MKFLSGTKRRIGFTAVLMIAICAVVVSLGAASPALAIPDDCATARGFGYTQTDVEIAHDVALGADGVLEAIPQDSLTVPARVAAVAIWAVPQGVYRGFEHTYNIVQACDDNDHQQLVQDNLDAKISTRATQTSVNTIQTTMDDEADLSLRLAIESNLARLETATPIAMFELPASQGGYIEVTRDIVTDVIAKMQAAGESVGRAPNILAEGNAFLAAQKYKHAYRMYGMAYRRAAS
jgi:hypothetical protein